MKKVISLGNALTDIVVNLGSDELLEQFSLLRGSMNLMDQIRQHDISQAVEGMNRVMSIGGSASNMIRAMAMLGTPVGYVGKVGPDSVGDFFEQTMRNLGIDAHILRGAGDSGRCLSLVSSDGERTMCTYLGAALELEVDEIRPEMFSGYDYLYIEGYQVQNHALITSAVQKAKDAGLQVALDLASYNVVEENHTFLKELVEQYVDVLFANEFEARAFTHEENPLEALDRMAAKVSLAVVMAGEQGSYIKQRGKVDHVGIMAAPRLVDTTGAGDTYAAGFMYGLSKGLSMLQCGTIGAIVASKVIQTMGTTLEPTHWEEIHKYVEKVEQGLYIF